MSAFVGLDPETSPDNALGETIDSHEGIVEETVEFDKLRDREEEEAGQQSCVEEVSAKLEERSCQGGLKAVRWNSFSELFDADGALHYLIYCVSACTRTSMKDLRLPERH